jgi:hypothetical protein
MLKKALKTSLLSSSIVEEVPMVQESDDVPLVETVEEEPEVPAALTKESLECMDAGRARGAARRKPFDKNSGMSCFSINSEKSTLSLCLIGKPGGSFCSNKAEDTFRSASFLKRIQEHEDEEEATPIILTPRTEKNRKFSSEILYEIKEVEQVEL